jgi:hypothetical protein
LTAEQIVFLSKVIDAKSVKAAKSVIEPGNYDLDFVLRAQGEFKLSQDTMKKSTVSIPLLAVLGLMVKRSGATREATIKMLADVIGEALSLDKDASKKLMEETGVKDAIDRVKTDLVDKLPLTHVQGSVRAQGQLNKINGL